MRTLLLVCLLTCPCWAQWQPYPCPDGGFVVEAPGQPKVTSHTNETPLGNVTEHIFRWEQPGLEWVINYSEVPEMATVMEGRPLFVEVRQGFKHTCGGKAVTHEQELQLYGHTGRTFQFQLPPQEGRPVRNGRARVFLVEQRLYVLTVTWDQPKLPTDQSAGDRFFDSFQLKP